MTALYFTALVFGYTLHGQALETAIWFSSYAQCVDAIPHMERIYDYVADTISTNDIYVWREETEIQSNTIIRPKLRPTDFP